MTGINPKDLHRLIGHVLIAAELYSEAAAALLLGTAAQESRGGRYLYQIGGGPGRGIFQMEPATEHDIWTNYLAYRSDLAARVTAITGHPCPGPWLAWDLAYQILMARIHYLRVPEPLPPTDNIPTQAIYWKRYYNTRRGRGHPAEFISAVQRYGIDQCLT